MQRWVQDKTRAHEALCAVFSLMLVLLLAVVELLLVSHLLPIERNLLLDSSLNNLWDDFVDLLYPNYNQLDYSIHYHHKLQHRNQNLQDNMRNIHVNYKA